VLLACAVMGVVFGAGLMYPTIAVEGSDAFDAISRSFSYVFARPWRLAFYLLCALLYAAVTYLFLRAVVFVALGLAHAFLTGWTDAGQVPDGTTSLAHVWPGPRMDELTPVPAYAAMPFGERVSSYFLHFWVYLFTSLLGAYLLSLFVTLNTIVYYLMRQEVDAAELDDVYLEAGDTGDEFEEDVPEIVKLDGPAPGAPAEATPAAVRADATP